MATVIPFTQLNRPIRVDTELGPDVLLLTGFNGMEAVSQPFAFQLDLLSIHPEIDPAALLRKPVLVTVRLDNGEKRYIHGLCSRFAQGHQRDNLTSYRAEIAPWLWFLQLSRESRIYQNLKVDEIIEQVFRRLGYTDFENRLLRSYPQRTYCVQYRETHLDFISRLMEEEGIFYYFEHTEEKHVLVLCDDNSVIEPGPAETARFTTQDSGTDEVIWNLEREHAVHPSMVTLSDYDPLQPTLDLERSAGDPEFEEIYDYPAEYAQNAGKMDPEDGERLARLWLEAEEAEGQVVRGGGNVRGLVPGYNFALKEHYRGDLNTKYIVTQVQHLATSGQLRAWAADTPVDYRNTFTAIPHDVPYRPRRRTPQPLIHGSQSALVVGPPGEEIYVDQYGRVKVQFYWDRDGQRNEGSSCWVRVSSFWAGQNWGAVFLPRVGHEVIVQFLEGDPDQPMIVGQVYHASNRPPYELPANQTQSGIKSRSTPNGTASDFNEIRFEDKKDAEEIYIHAERNLRTVVEASEIRSIGGSRTTTIHKKDDTLILKEGNRDVTIELGEDILLVQTGNRATQIAQGNDELQVSSGDISVLAPVGKHRLQANQVEVVGTTQIKLACGGSSIELTPAGITIKGINVKIEGVGMLESTSPLTTVKGTGMLVLEGGGVANLKGAVVLIN